jgi:UDP-N-acetylglucosamine acyltransferase
MEGARIGKIAISRSSYFSRTQDLKFGGEESLAIIGDNCTIRECVTINRGTIASGQTVIGNNCLIMASAHSTDCHVGNNAIIVNGVLLGHVTG